MGTRYGVRPRSTQPRSGELWRQTGQSFAVLSYEITNDVKRCHINAIHEFLSRSYWSPGVPKVSSPVQSPTRSASVSFKAPRRWGSHAWSQIGPSSRISPTSTSSKSVGNGLAKRLMEAVLAHPDLQGLRRMLLATEDAHTLYAKYGFKPLAAPEHMMEIHHRSAYAAGTGEDVDSV